MALNTSKSRETIMLHNLLFKNNANIPISSYHTLHANGFGGTFWDQSVLPIHLSTLSTGQYANFSTLSSFIYNAYLNELNYSTTYASTLLTLQTDILSNTVQYENSINTLSNIYIIDSNQTWIKFSTFSNATVSTVNDVFWGGRAVMYSTLSKVASYSTFWTSTNTHINSNNISFAVLSTLTNVGDSSNLSSLSAILNSGMSTVYGSSIQLATSGFSSFGSAIKNSQANAFSNFYKDALTSTTGGLIAEETFYRNELGNTISSFDSSYISSFLVIQSTIEGVNGRVNNLTEFNSSIYYFQLSSYIAESFSSLNRKYLTFYSSVGASISSLAFSTFILQSSINSVGLSLSTSQNSTLFNSYNLELSTLGYEYVSLSTYSIPYGIYSSFANIPYNTSNYYVSTVNQEDAFTNMLIFSTNAIAQSSYGGFYSSFTRSVQMSTISSAIQFLGNEFQTTASSLYDYTNSYLSSSLNSTINSLSTSAYNTLDFSASSYVTGLSDIAFSSLTGYMTIPFSTAIDSFSIIANQSISSFNASTIANQSTYDSVFSSSYSKYASTIAEFYSTQYNVLSAAGLIATVYRVRYIRVERTNGLTTDPINLAEIEAYDENNAKITTGLSITYSSSLPLFPVENMINGNLLDFGHTGGVVLPNEWVMVDLGQTRTVSKVRVLGRFAADFRNVGLTVFLRNQLGQNVYVSSEINVAKQDYYFLDDFSVNRNQFQSFEKTTVFAQYVRIQRTNGLATQPINLAEIQVFDENNAIITSGLSVTYSSVYGPPYGPSFPIENMINGNLLDFGHTGGAISLNEFVMINLGRLRPITKVNILGRPSFDFRNVGLTLSLRDNFNNPIYIGSEITQAQLSYEYRFGFILPYQTWNSQLSTYDGLFNSSINSYCIFGNSTITSSATARQPFVYPSTSVSLSSITGSTLQYFTNYSNAVTRGNSTVVGNIVSTLITDQQFLLTGSNFLANLDFQNFQNFLIYVSTPIVNGPSSYTITYNSNAISNLNFKNGLITVGVNTVGNGYTFNNGRMQIETYTLGIPTTIFSEIEPSISNTLTRYIYKYVILNNVVYTNLLNFYEFNEINYNFRTTPIVGNTIANSGSMSIGPAIITSGSSSVVNGGSVQLTNAGSSKIVTPFASNIKTISIWLRIDTYDPNFFFVFDLRPAVFGWLNRSGNTSGNGLDGSLLYIDGVYKSVLFYPGTANLVHVPTNDSQFHLVTVVIPNTTTVSGSFTFCNRFEYFGTGGMTGYVGGIYMHRYRLSQRKITQLYKYYAA
jgi:hypothetical protein